jgi:hypothetical protein
LNLSLVLKFVLKFVIPTERVFCATEESAVQVLKAHAWFWEGHGFSRAKQEHPSPALAAEANK